jgi:hypothetical protein
MLLKMSGEMRASSAVCGVYLQSLVSGMKTLREYVMTLPFERRCLGTRSSKESVSIS